MRRPTGWPGNIGADVGGAIGPRPGAVGDDPGDGDGKGKEWAWSGKSRFTRRDIRESSGWSDFQVKTHIGELEDLEYLYSVAGKKGKEYVYELVAAEGGEDGKPFLAGLMKVEALGLSTSGLSTR